MGRQAGLVLSPVFIHTHTHTWMYSISAAVVPAHRQQPAPALPAMDGAALGAGGLQGLPYQPPVRSAQLVKHSSLSRLHGGICMYHMVVRALSAHLCYMVLRPQFMW
jgi:hypothetical protein